MVRSAKITILCLAVGACSASDATVGISDGTDGDAVKSTTVLSRQDLGTLGGAFSYAADINSGNTVVGWSQTSTGAIHAFSWSAGPGMVDLGTLPGDESSRALAILDSKGQGDALILGVSTRGSQSTPVVWSTTGAIRALPIPPIATGAMSLPTDFNSRGDVVGSDAGVGLQHGWVWLTNGTKYDLSANVSGGSTEGSANAVSSPGVVLLTTRASTCKRTTDCWRTYLWRSNGGYSALGTPGNDPEANVTGLALTDGGDVVGWLTSAATGGVTPYRWNAGGGFTALAHYATDGSRYGYASAVNSTGTIVGGDWDPAAGAIVDGTTMERAKARGLAPETYLSEFNAYAFFDKLGDAIITGATGNNLRDLRILLAY